MNTKTLQVSKAMHFLIKFVKRPRDDLSHYVYSEDKKETLRIIRPLVDLQSGSLKVKESKSSRVDIYKSRLYRFVKVICVTKRE